MTSVDRVGRGGSREIDSSSLESLLELSTVQALNLSGAMIEGRMDAQKGCVDSSDKVKSLVETQLRPSQAHKTKESVTESHSIMWVSLQIISL